MMKVLVILLMVALDVMAVPSKEVKAPDVDIPGGLDRSETPQFVMLTFDDAVNIFSFQYYRQALYGRKNPNNCPVAATFFLSHEYSDYSMVHELHANGQQISLKSTINHLTNTSLPTLVQEFTDLRTLTSYFAKIPEEDIKGIRYPFLRMTGIDQLEVVKQGGFLYDMSWMFTQPSMWPYTSDYPESFSDAWIIPMINWRDQNQTVCSMVDACVDVPKDVEGLTQWMIGEFNKQYNGNRAPFGFYVHAAWLAETVNPNHLPAYIAFLDYLQTLPDVYLASGSQIIDWVKSPVPFSQMKPGDTECQKTYTPFCQPLLCQLKKGDNERWMTCCADTCPNSYPWPGNPLGTL